MLRVENISVNIDNIKIISDVSFRLEEHDIFMVVGPNGAGKTTLFRAIMGAINHDGRVSIDNTDIKTYKNRELAKKIGVLTQKHQPQFDHSVYDIVSLGRYAHQKGMLGSLNNEDKEIIEESLRLTGLFGMQDRSVLTLSGGEMQRTFLAQLFAQNPNILILDEPTTHLDLQYQIAIFDIIKKWVAGEDRAVLAVVHDLNTAYAYGNKALLLSEGRAYAQGAINQVLTRENLKSVYKVDVVEWVKNAMGIVR